MTFKNFLTKQIFFEFSRLCSIIFLSYEYVVYDIWFYTIKYDFFFMKKNLKHLLKLSKY